MFHARVLLGEADADSAKRVKEILDSAGYMVTVEGDGKKVPACYTICTFVVGADFSSAGRYSFRGFGLCTGR